HYSCSPGDPESVEDLSLEGWGWIEDAIREVSKEITRKHDLQRFFSRVRELGMGVDSEDNFVQPASRSEIYAAFQRRALPALIRTDVLPPRPSLYLGAIRSGGDLPCTIALYPDTGDGSLMERLEAAGLGDVQVKGVASPILLSWLEVVPLGAGDAVAPVLRLTSQTVFKTAEACGKFAPFGGEVFNEGETVYCEDGPLDEDYLSYAHSITAALDERTNSSADYYTEVNLDHDAHAAYRKSL